MRATSIWIVAPATLLCAGARALGAQPVTYSGQVAPILEAHCVSCHRAGANAAAVALGTYEQVRDRSASILSQVDSGTMPPWPIDAAHSAPMSNDPRPSHAEVDTLRAWVATGMAPGAAAAPAAQRSAAVLQAQAWAQPEHHVPDAIVALPSIPVPAQGELPYYRLLVKVTLPEDHWIGALQALPGDPAVVHHMGITEIRLPQGVGPQQIRELDQVATKMGLPSRSLVTEEPAIVDAALFGNYDMLAAFTPGEGFESFPPGTGKLLKAGDNYYINFNIHYTTTGTATSDRSRLGLWFLKSAPARQLFRTPSAGRTILAEGHELFPDDPGSKAEGTDVAIPPIPPYADHYELVGITAYDRAVTLYSFQPHAHLRAKDFRYDLVYPDGHTQTILSIPRYDYHWQLSYELATPVELPAGAKLVVTAHYDNSAANAHLREFSLQDPAARCGPDKYAFFRSQNQTWDEMFSPIVQYAVHTGGSDRTHLPTVAVQGCLTTVRASSWALIGASQATPTQSPTISRAELAATAPAAGRSRYGLIGLDAFAAQTFAGKRVLVKGIQIPDRHSSSINVTALQDLGGACEP
jgi:mono/diheme cytochrome c family protein